MCRRPVWALWKPLNNWLQQLHFRWLSTTARFIHIATETFHDVLFHAKSPDCRAFTARGSGGAEAPVSRERWLVNSRCIQPREVQKVEKIVHNPVDLEVAGP